MDAAQNNQTPTDLDSPSGRRLSPQSQSHPHQPLAPLEYLQNQRRGSITDPSLHVSPPDPAAYHYQPSLSQEQRVKRSPRTFRPKSPFRFGDASLNPPDLSNPNIRRLLRSPSNEALDPAHSPDRSDDSSRTRDPRSTSMTPEYRPPHEDSRQWTRHDNFRDRRSGAMDIGHNPQEDPNLRRPLPLNYNRTGSAAPSADFDFPIRRHSIAEHPVPHHGMPHPSELLPTPSQSPSIPSLPQGLKRKMSSDRGLNPMEEEDPSHPQSGLPEIQGPAPKRRGSAFDTHRIAQLSLYDRRDSMDSRIPSHPPPQWWSQQDRRDSTASMFSNVSMTSTGGYSSSGFSGESAFPPRPGLANMAWPAPPHPGAALNHEAEAPMAGLPRQPQQRPVADDSLSPYPPGPPIMPPDRRMSVPELSMQRNLRSRSRPAPVLSRTVERQPSSNPSDADGMAEDSETSPTAQTHVIHPTTSVKEGTSPYSRSPELRVSHKLAERKRRKEMKDLFDELRDHLPADRGMKASKWEILTKAVDYIQTLKTQQQDMMREIEMLRHEVQVSRSNNDFQQPAPSNHPHNFSHVNNAFGQQSLQAPPTQQSPTESTSGT